MNTTDKAREICAECGGRSDEAGMFHDAEGFLRTLCSACVERSNDGQPAALLAYGIGAEDRITMHDIASGQDHTFVRDFDFTDVEKVQATYPQAKIVRWKARSVGAGNSDQPGSLLVIDREAMPQEILAEVRSVFRRANAAQRAAAGALYTAVELAADAGMPETQIAEALGVNRLTVRRALGK